MCIVYACDKVETNTKRIYTRFVQIQIPRESIKNTDETIIHRKCSASRRNKMIIKLLNISYI